MRGVCFTCLLFWVPSVYAGAINVPLGTADSFAVLGGSTVTSTGATAVVGDLGVWAGASITGFGPGTVSGTIHSADAVAMQAQEDLTTAYNFAAAEPCGQILTGQDLGGTTLLPGVYCFSSSAQLTGILTLNAQGNPNGVFVFQIGSTLVTASNSSIVFTNGGSGDRVFWQVGSSATIGSATVFAGDILALSSITLDTNADITCGRALARNGAVTMDTNQVSISAGCALVSSPEPSTVWPMLLIVAIGWGGLKCTGSTSFRFAAIGHRRGPRRP